jgi:hypothetical protein
MEGWRSPNLIFSTIPINLDLDTHPTRIYKLAQEATIQTHKSLHIPDDTTICIIYNIRLDKLEDV